jgi:hypothetical protein
MEHPFSSKGSVHLLNIGTAALLYNQNFIALMWLVSPYVHCSGWSVRKTQKCTYSLRVVVQEKLFKSSCVFFVRAARGSRIVLCYVTDKIDWSGAKRRLFGALFVVILWQLHSIIIVLGVKWTQKPYFSLTDFICKTHYVLFFRAAWFLFFHKWDCRLGANIVAAWYTDGATRRRIKTENAAYTGHDHGGPQPNHPHPGSKGSLDRNNLGSNPRHPCNRRTCPYFDDGKMHGQDGTSVSVSRAPVIVTFPCQPSSGFVCSNC